MKKTFAVLGAVLSVAACAHNDYECGQQYTEEPCPCQEAAPAPQPTPAPVYEPRYEAPVTYTQPTCGSCQGEVRTVREPVEVVYKRTTYGTVYEPRHFENVAYERQYVNGATYQQAVVEQPAVVENAAVVSEQEYVVPTVQPVAPQPAPVARKYNGPVVIVPAQQ